MFKLNQSAAIGNKNGSKIPCNKVHGVLWSFEQDGLGWFDIWRHRATKMSNDDDNDLSFIPHIFISQWTFQTNIGYKIQTYFVLDFILLQSNSKHSSSFFFNEMLVTQTAAAHVVFSHLFYIFVFGLTSQLFLCSCEKFTEFTSGELMSP